jgi:hypothetical protein
MKGIVPADGSGTPLYPKSDYDRYLHRLLEGDEAGPA